MAAGRCARDLSHPPKVPFGTRLAASSRPRSTKKFARSIFYLLLYVVDARFASTL